jgi:hypothetical protein
LEEGGAALPAAAGPAAFFARPGLATAAAIIFRRGEAGDAVLPPRPFTAGLPIFTPAVAVVATAGGDVLSGVCCGCLLSALAEALEGVRVRGGAAAVGFLARLAAAGGVRPAEGSLAEN